MNKNELKSRIKNLQELDVLSRKIKNYSLKKLLRLWNKFDIKAKDEPKLKVVGKEINARYSEFEKIDVLV